MKVVKESALIKIATIQKCIDCGAVMQINESDLSTSKFNKRLWYKCPCCKSEQVAIRADEGKEGFFTTYKEVRSDETDIMIFAGVVYFVGVILLAFVAGIVIALI
jgi:uncharacterized protein YlaI